MKLIFFALVVLEACLIMVAISPISPFINLNKAVVAYDAWQKNPTAENEASRLREKAALKRKHLFETVCIYSLLAINAVGMIVLFRKLKRLTKHNA